MELNRNKCPWCGAVSAGKPEACPSCGGDLIEHRASIDEYNRGIDYFDEKNYISAAKSFFNVSTYRDSRDKLKECLDIIKNHELLKAILEKGSRDIADYSSIVEKSISDGFDYFYFKNIKNELDNICKEGWVKDYVNCSAVVLSFFDELETWKKYQSAIRLYNSNDYNEASCAFFEIGAYRDSLDYLGKSLCKHSPLLSAIMKTGSRNLEDYIDIVKAEKNGEDFFKNLVDSINGIDDREWADKYVSACQLAKDFTILLESIKYCEENPLFRAIREKGSKDLVDYLEIVEKPHDDGFDYFYFKNIRDKLGNACKEDWVQDYVNCSVVALSFFDELDTWKKYQKAVSLYNSKDYQNAIEKLLRLRAYRDSFDYLCKALNKESPLLGAIVEKGSANIEDYVDIIKAEDKSHDKLFFKDIARHIGFIDDNDFAKKYKSACEMAEGFIDSFDVYIEYKKAIDLYNSESYFEAQKVFFKLGDYSDSKKYFEKSVQGMLEVSPLLIAIIEKGSTDFQDYADIIRAEDKSHDKLFFKDLAKHFGGIANEDWAKKYKSACETASKLIDSFGVQTKYETAIDLYNSESYFKAQKAFFKLGDYLDSKKYFEKSVQGMFEAIPFLKSISNGEGEEESKKFAHEVEETEIQKACKLVEEAKGFGGKEKYLELFKRAFEIKDIVKKEEKFAIDTEDYNKQELLVALLNEKSPKYDDYEEIISRTRNELGASIKDICIIVKKANLTEHYNNCLLAEAFIAIYDELQRERDKINNNELLRAMYTGKANDYVNCKGLAKAENSKAFSKYVGDISLYFFPNGWNDIKREAAKKAKLEEKMKSISNIYERAKTYVVIAELEKGLDDVVQELGDDELIAALLKNKALKYEDAGDLLKNGKDASTYLNFYHRLNQIYETERIIWMRKDCLGISEKMRAYMEACLRAKGFMESKHRVLPYEIAEEKYMGIELLKSLASKGSKNHTDHREAIIASLECVQQIKAIQKDLEQLEIDGISFSSPVKAEGWDKKTKQYIENCRAAINLIKGFDENEKALEAKRQKAEQERIEKERIEAEQKAEQERKEAERRAEQERIEAERERIEAEREQKEAKKEHWLSIVAMCLPIALSLILGIILFANKVQISIVSSFGLWVFLWIALTLVSITVSLVLLDDKYGNKLAIQKGIKLPSAKKCIIVTAIVAIIAFAIAIIGLESNFNPPKSIDITITDKDNHYNDGNYTSTIEIYVSNTGNAKATHIMGEMCLYDGDELIGTANVELRGTFNSKTDVVIDLEYSNEMLYYTTYSSLKATLKITGMKFDGSEKLYEYDVDAIVLNKKW